MGDVQELGHDGGRGDLDEDDVVEADAVERVEQREAALDLVRFDHALEDVLDGHALTLACQVVRDGEDSSEIVGRVSPWNNDVCFIFRKESVGRATVMVKHDVTFGSEEAVVKVEPADDGPDVERSSDWVELVIGPGDLSSWERRMSGADSAARARSEWGWAHRWGRWCPRRRGRVGSDTRGNAGPRGHSR